MSEPISSSIATNSATALAGSAGVAIAGFNIGVGVGTILMACLGACFAMSLESEGKLALKAVKIVGTALAGIGLSFVAAAVVVWLMGLLPGQTKIEVSFDAVQMMTSFFISYQLHRTILPGSDKVSSSLLGRLITWGKEK